MKVKDFEAEVNAGINENCILKAKAALTESARELIAAKAVVKKLEKRHNELLEMNIEEFLFEDIPQCSSDDCSNNPLCKGGYFIKKSDE